MTTSILIVDDSVPFLDVARRLLARDGFEVLGTATTSAEAEAQVETLRPQVALVDVNLGGESGFDVARRLVRSGQVAPPSIILTSTHSEAEFADLIAQCPVAGFVPKERLSGAAIRLALSGGKR